MLVTPDAAADDGLFDVCLADRMSPARIVMMLPRFIKGSHLAMPEVTTFKAREVSLESTTTIYYQIDGEVLEDKRLVFRLIPRGLTVVGASFIPSPAAAVSATAGEQRS